MVNIQTLEAAILVRKNLIEQLTKEIEAFETVRADLLHRKEPAKQIYLKTLDQMPQQFTAADFVKQARANGLRAITPHNLGEWLRKDKSLRYVYNRRWSKYHKL